jgi:hypothetical protein
VDVIFLQPQTKKGKHTMKDRFVPNPTIMRPLRSGPLAAYLDSFAARLVQQGHCSHDYYHGVIVGLTGTVNQAAELPLQPSIGLVNCGGSEIITVVNS